MARAQILIVEDDSIISVHIQRILKMLGYGVSGVTVSGKDALQKVEELQPDLVLMDISLQGSMDGIETAEEVHKRFQVPVVFITAYADEGTLRRAKDTQPYGYILKPFDDRDLYIAIELALYKYKLEAQLRESEERYRTLFENVPIGMYRTTPEGSILAANPALVMLLGYSSGEELAQVNLEEAQFDTQRTRAEFKQTIEQNGMIRNYITEWRRKDGVLVRVCENALVVRDQNGQVCFYEGVVEDLSQRR